jgi:hypothetical protein
MCKIDYPVESFFRTKFHNLIFGILFLKIIIIVSLIFTLIKLEAIIFLFFNFYFHLHIINKKHNYQNGWLIESKLSNL